MLYPVSWCCVDTLVSMCQSCLLPLLYALLSFSLPLCLCVSLSLLLHTGSVTEPGAGAWEIQAHFFKTLQPKKKKLFQATYS